MEDILITIDGPAASGKSSISKMLAKYLGFVYVDTGAMYRTTALYMLENKVDTGNDEEIERALKSIKIEMNPFEGVFLNGENVSSKIRTPEISMAASKISAKKEVRSFLLGIQKEIGKNKKAVFEGRDMGTIVFPDADIKFFLTADNETRAKRRFLQLGDKSSQTYEDVLKDMGKRDKDDSNREHAPLKPAKDCFYIDSSNKGVKEVKDEMIKLIEAKFLP